MFLNKRIWLFLSVLLLSAFSGGCTQSESNLENENPDEEPTEEILIDKEAPDNFNFIVNYGPYGKQKVDTFDDVVIKDLVTAGTAEAGISLSDNEMGQIYNEMIRIDIMQISELDPDEDEVCVTIPPLISEWTIQMNNETNSFSLDRYCAPPEINSDLADLEGFIHDIVSAKEEYKELPEAVGFYD